ncbi:MAG: hypothetical protein HQL44_11130 [Alphaproteobacteria bacterium]|nr:hypothetical protein [Alphaproteobacteria bacterium]
MTATKLHIGLSYDDSLPEDPISDFRRIVSADGLDIRIESHPPPGPFAGLEWLLSTAVVLFIGKAYFEGFLSEAGKEHYHLLKSGMKHLLKHFGRRTVTLVGSQGKVHREQPYSLLYSILAEAGPNRKIKFLIPMDVSDEEADRSIEVIADFLVAHYSNSLDDTMNDALVQTRAIGGTVLLAINPETGRLQIINPISRQFEDS